MREAIARELLELGSRLADLSRRVEELEGAEADSGPSDGASLLSTTEVRCAVQVSETQ